MKRITSIIAFAVLVLTSSYALDGSQKTDDYGYFPTKTETVAKATTPTSATTSKIVTTPANNTMTVSVKATASDPIKTTKAAVPVAFDHSVFDALLKAHVSNTGKVDYAAIKAKSALLDSYVNLLSVSVPAASASNNERLAYWINAYNANTIKLIVDNYPVKSIMDLHGGKAFDKKWIKMGGETLSLNDIENTKIRAKFNEPRIHFAVNCAAKSCPPILNKAWQASSLQATLEARTKAFVNDAAYNQVSGSSISLSKIFEWYAKDFPADIKSYISQYSKVKVASDASVSYIEYDWALNE